MLCVAPIRLICDSLMVVNITCCWFTLYIVLLLAFPWWVVENLPKSRSTSGLTGHGIARVSGSVSQRPAAQTVWYAMPHGRKSSPAVSFQLWIPPETGPGWWFQSCFMFHFIFHICDVIPTPLTKSIIFQMVKLHHQPGYSPSLTNNNHNH
jgi:hypothetical protein